MASRFFVSGGVGALLVAGLFVAPPGCSSNPAETELGGLDQPCFPGDTCNPDSGLICLAIPDDAGTDGGQCVQLDAGEDASDNAAIDSALSGDAPPDTTVREAADESPAHTESETGADAPTDAPTDMITDSAADTSPDSATDAQGD
jgi:hypothetical protein